MQQGLTNEGRYARFTLPWTSRSLSPRLALTLNASIGVLFAVAFVFGSWRDGTTTLRGENVGLLEHPGIWIFIVAQIISPIVVSRSITKFISLADRPGLPLNENFIATRFRPLSEHLLRILKRDTTRSKRAFDVLLLLGLLVWGWNTLQNLNAQQIAKFDFWDSSAHFWGYWLTRGYKIYIWLIVVPVLWHVQICIVYVLRRILIAAKTEAALVLDPYHPDCAGGTRSFIDGILTPMFALVLPAVLLATAATWVHGKYDITTIGGISLTVMLFLSIYVYPAAVLRTAIIAEKDRQKRQLSALQRTLYDGLLREQPIATTLKDPTAVLLSLSAVTQRVDSLPNWPQFARVAQVAIIFAGSPFIAPLLKDLPARLAELLS